MLTNETRHEKCSDLNLISGFFQNFYYCSDSKMQKKSLACYQTKTILCVIFRFFLQHPLSCLWDTEIESCFLRKSWHNFLWGKRYFTLFYHFEWVCFRETKYFFLNFVISEITTWHFGVSDWCLNFFFNLAALK